MLANPPPSFHMNQDMMLMQQQQQQQLSNDVISEILSWLPVSTINLFKSVSKSWFNLITSCIKNPSFVESHVHHSNQNNRDLTILLYLSINGILCPLQLTADNNGSVGHVHVPTNDDCVSIVEIQNKFDSCSFRCNSIYHDDDLDDIFGRLVIPVELYIYGSCNGLMIISLYDDFDICLWNPSTHEIKEIPNAPFEWAYWSSEDDGYNRSGSYELFYDDIVGDYKIMKYMFIHPYDGSNLYFDSKVLVYTLGANSWRHIPDPYKLPRTRDCHYPQKPLFLKGAHHWITYKHEANDPLSLSILAFDVAGEEYREVPTPQICSKMHEPKLDMIRGYLCICYYDNGGTYHPGYDGYRHLNVWAMKDYGVKDSWTKLFSTHMQPELVHEAQFLKVLWSFENGDILIQKDGRDIFLFDPESGDKAKFLTTTPPCFVDICHSALFKGSFVSLNSDTYLHMIKYRGEQEKGTHLMMKYRGEQEEAKKKKKKKKKNKRKKKIIQQ